MSSTILSHLRPHHGLDALDDLLLRLHPAAQETPQDGDGDHQRGARAKTVR